MSEIIRDRGREPVSMIALVGTTASIAIPVITSLLIVWGDIRELKHSVRINEDKIHAIRDNFITLDPVSGQEWRASTKKIMDELQMNRRLFLKLMPRQDQ